MGQNRDQRFYNDGLARALDLVKAGGVELLEQELKQRGIKDLPPNVPVYLVHKAAREYCKDELMIVATAMADTIAYDMRLPPSVVVDFLRNFNTKCDRFRMDAEMYENARKRLDEEYAMNVIINKFNQEEIGI
ncbi:MAG: hypothetical protein SPG09_12765 [Lachnospiraceae bacterium]|nr:hypothetical protein [bacterium]MDY5518461.1 hypothetical protein [Lachnospiraceae bacterium]